MCHRCIERSTGVEWACKVINKRKVSSNYNGLLEQFQNEIEVSQSESSAVRGCAF